MKLRQTLISVTKNLTNLAFFAFVLSCVTPAEIDTIYQNQQLVVSGVVSTIGERNIVTVGMTSTTARLPDPVVQATVILRDGAGNTFYYQEDPGKPGTYALPWYNAVPGQTYHIEIVTPDGQTLKSLPEAIPPSAGMLQTSHQFSEEEVVDHEGTVIRSNFVNIYANSAFNDLVSPRYIKWNVEETYLIRPTNFPDPFGSTPPDCFVTQNADPQHIVTFDRNEVKDLQLSDILVGARVADQTFHYKHYFTVYQSAVSKAAFEYWRKVNIVANQAGSIFDSPPAFVTGNMINATRPEQKVLGYFQSVNQTFSRFFLLKEDLPFILLPYCDYDYNRPYDDYPYECLDCLRIRSSTWERPPWF